MKTIHIDKPFIAIDSDLSEGITYDGRNSSLLWIDIGKGTIYRTFLDNNDEHGEIQKYTIDKSVGVIGLTTDPNVILAGCSTTIKTLNLETSKFSVIAKYPNNNVSSNGWHLRSNDGSVDPFGNFWVGTMCDSSCPEVKNLGTLYRLNTNLSLDPIIKNVGIPNGLNWYDGNMYWTSSKEHIIYKFEMDNDTKLPALSTKIKFIETEKLFKDYIDETLIDGEPDGFCIDSKGSIYTAVWGTNRVLKIDHRGTLQEQIIFPANRISCTTIGGKNMDTLFVTSGRLDKKTKKDMGGCIFKLKLTDGIKGTEKHKWQGPLSL